MNKAGILEVLNDQLTFLKNNEFKSFDLCDITSQPYFLKINLLTHGKSWGKYVRYPHNILLDKFTPQLRRVFKIEKQDFAQSNAFIVRGLLGLYEYTNDDLYLKEATSLIERIIQQKSKGFKHSAWGQPYNWFSGLVIPTYTPRTTVTSQVGRMFLDAYLITNESTYLEEAKSIGRFFLEEMPLSFENEEQTCYSYTSIDTHKVHNPNMMASAFLGMLSNLSQEKTFLERSKSAANFTFSHLNEDGSWYYALLPLSKPSKIDNYHTGYNLEATAILKKYWPEFPFQIKFEKSVSYYEKSLFTNDGLPQLTNKKQFPIDIQCCAQSIITRVFLNEYFEGSLEKAKNLYKWTVDHMYSDGSYYYRTFKNGKKDKTDYIRWGDAWMFYVGSLLLK